MQYSKKQLDQYKVSYSVAVDREQLQKSHQVALKQLGKNVRNAVRILSDKLIGNNIIFIIHFILITSRNFLRFEKAV